MKRAKKVFENEGISVQPYPVDFKSNKSFISSLRNPLKWMPSSSSLNKSSSGIREIIGRFIYGAWRYIFFTNLFISDYLAIICISKDNFV